MDLQSIQDQINLLKIQLAQLIQISETEVAAMMQVMIDPSIEIIANMKNDIAASKAECARLLDLITDLSDPVKTSLTSNIQIVSDGLDAQLDDLDE